MQSQPFYQTGTAGHIHQYNFTYCKQCWLIGQAFPRACAFWLCHPVMQDNQKFVEQHKSEIKAGIR
jgi:hypothetical protein